MEGAAPVDAAKLKADLKVQLEQCLDKVAASLNAAADGRILADSEEVARGALHGFAQAVYETAVQQKIDAAEAAFSPSREPQDG